MITAEILPFKPTTSYNPQGAEIVSLIYALADEGIAVVEGNK